MKCKRGDVILINYPNSDQKTYKKRPALVVQADDLNTGLSQRIIALITSNTNRIGKTRVHFFQNSSDGQAMQLKSDSVVVTDSLATVLDREIDKIIGNCPSMYKVDQALRYTFGL